MEITTVVGSIGAVLSLLVGIGEKASSFYGTDSLIVVVGGTLATTLIAHPLREVVNLFSVYAKAFSLRASRPTKVIARIVGLSETARREGILALENEVSSKDDTFLAQGVRLAVDGTEPDLIMDILETELQFIEERHARAQQMLGFIGTNGLVFGGISATLSVALQTESTGLAAASVAALPLCYGLILFGLFSAPFRLKLKAFSGPKVRKKCSWEVSRSPSILIPPLLRPDRRAATGTAPLRSPTPLARCDPGL